MATVIISGDPIPPAAVDRSAGPGAPGLLRGLVIGAIAVLFLSGPAAFADGSISLDPARNATRWLSEHDAANFKEALRLADRRQWDSALAYGRKLKDPVAADIIEWRYLSAQNTYPTFTRLIDFVQLHPDWPDYKDLLKRAEESLPYSYPPAKVVAIFAGQEPLTGAGKYKLGAAYVALGQKDYGYFWIRQAWTRHILNPEVEDRILSDYKDVLTRKDHEDRLNLLTWYGASTAARRLYSLVSDDRKAVAEARFKMRATGNVRASLAAVPKALRHDPGLVYEEARIYTKAGQEDQARDILTYAPREEDRLVRPDLWWDERQVLARRAIENKLYGEAYRLAADYPGKDGGIEFAEAQWLAGWLALRYLDDPEQALVHFNALYDGVTYPISRARAAYWLGRTYDRLHKPKEATQAYQQAARFETTFYGQLAAERLASNGPAHLTLPDPWPVSADDTAQLLKRDVVKACILLHDFGQPMTLREFVFHLAGYFDDPATLAAFSDLMGRFGYPHYALKVAKKASLRHVFLVDRAYPVDDVPRPSGEVASAEPALVLGLARQESEFNPKAESGAGALGTMQLLPGTAREVARKYRLRYDAGRLARDGAYNMTLGSAHLRDLVKRYDGSYILAAAAYNAGPTRVREWLPVYGDPRDPRVDPVDWIESIPLSETRNYVQRVLENTQVYRYRLAHSKAPLLLMADLGIRQAATTYASAWPSEPETDTAHLSPAPVAASMIGFGGPHHKPPAEQDDSQLAALDPSTGGAAPAVRPLLPENVPQPKPGRATVDATLALPTPKPLLPAPATTAAGGIVVPVEKPDSGT